ncbi:hypothetical protein PFISCL1PPCAC_25744 [Pristionchus fissidentatus]|uniref:Uncharacterized protein n=1 Tax=Pristionchus fissidentatus TaxID=1538716 RepID=A0AAV5WR08_9BILA|nr:hypothetical protein PFISCL1PPCAC_25744 [Pristionchus fissidentatus]
MAPFFSEKRGDDTVPLTTVESATSFKKQKYHQCRLSALIIVGFLLFVGISALVCFYVNKSTSTITITTQPNTDEQFNIRALGQATGQILHTRYANFIMLTLYGSSAFNHSSNLTVDSYTISVYNEDNLLLGGGKYQPVDNQIHGSYKIHTKSSHNDTAYTRLGVRTVVILDEGQKGFDQCRASPYISEIDSEIVLRYDFSVHFFTGEYNFFGTEIMGRADYTETHKTRCGCVIDEVDCV